MTSWFESASKTLAHDKRPRYSAARRLVSLVVGVVLAVSAFFFPLPGLVTRAQAAVVSPSLQTYHFVVYANQDVPGRDTGIAVVPETHITIMARGLASYGHEGAADCTGYPLTNPDGQRFLNGKRCSPKIDSNAVLPYAPIGELIANVGSSSTPGWFAVGSRYSATFYTSGQLFLLYNDEQISYVNNSGSYDVTVVTYLIHA